MCTMMCELPKYKGRWWAKSCQTTQKKILPTPPPTSNASPKKNNKVQAASL